MDRVYWGIVEGVLIAGLAVMLAVALRWLPESPRTRTLKMAATTWALVVAVVLLGKAWLLP